MSGPLAVVAIGGNALIVDEAHQSLEDQARAVASACASLSALVARGWRVVVTHGNGPQVGFILRRSEIASGEIPVVPMDYATADTQGAIGSMFQRTLPSVTLVTHVVVDPRDPAFGRPDKPIGPFYSEARARDLGSRLGWTVAEDSGRGWRRVVPSPRPQAIVELEDIRRLADQGRVVIACGGGGVPVFQLSAGGLKGVEAVIDKDRTSALLARSLGADVLILCTGVDAVYLGWGTPAQRRLDSLTASEARQLLTTGELGTGSMRPKVESALEFLGDPTAPRGPRAIIGKLDSLSALAEGQGGTTFVQGPP